MQGAVTGAYDIANVDVKNRVVLTNKMPSSLIRGFGGPQLYLALERLMAAHRGRAEARSARRDPAQSHSGGRNSPIAPRPARSTIPAIIYARSRSHSAMVGSTSSSAGANAARAAGRNYGIGFAAIVEPAMSNMGYLSTLMTRGGARKSRPEERRGVDGDGQHRSARRRHRHRRCHRAGAEPRDGAGADRRRRARAQARRHRSAFWKWTRRRINGRSPPAPIRAASPRAPRSRRTWRRCRCATS